MPSVAVVIPAFNRRDITLNSLRQLEELDWAGVDHTVIVIDDGSTDGTGQAILNTYPSAIVLQGNGDLWWTGAINLGLRHAIDIDADYVLLLNDDLEVDHSFFKNIWSAASLHKGALIGGVKLARNSEGDEYVVSGPFMVNGFLQKIENPCSGWPIEKLENEKHIQCDLLGGAALLIPLDIVHSIGFMDFKRFPHNWGDFEFTRRAKLAGYNCVLVTGAKVITDRDNPNYEPRYRFESKRTDYFKNLFDNHKYFYGFTGVFRKAFFHKPVLPGVIMYTYLTGRLLIWSVLKLFLPSDLLAHYKKKI